MNHKRDLGKKGEKLAANLLLQSDYEILTKNFNTRFGEIDIIAKDGDTLVFIEVKTRWNREFGVPEESITPKKLKKIEKVGEIFRSQNENLPKLERIDVVAIEIDENGEVTRREVIRNVSG
jgi:putative endonuclease